MECTVNWVGPASSAGASSAMKFLAETGSGHTLVMDGAPDIAKPDNGGANLAPGPWKHCWQVQAAAQPTTWC